MTGIEALAPNARKTAAAIDAACFGAERWSENSFGEELECPLTRCVAYRERGAIVGFAAMRCVFDRADIERVAVLPEHRRKGIATKLLRDLIEFGIGRGIKSFMLEVRESDAGAIAMYEKLGFERVGTRARYYGGVEAARVYALSVRFGSDADG